MVEFLLELQDEADQQEPRHLSPRLSDDSQRAAWLRLESQQLARGQQQLESLQQRPHPQRPQNPHLSDSRTTSADATAAGLLATRRGECPS